MRRIYTTAAMLFLLGSFAMAQDATTQPASQPTIVDPTDAAAAKAAEGKIVTVQGKIIRAAWGKSGKTMQARFSKDKESLIVVIFARAKDDMDKAFNGDVAAALNGATVSITGEVQDYRGRPEIVVDHVDQITIQKAATTEPAAQQ